MPLYPAYASQKGIIGASNYRPAYHVAMAAKILGAGVKHQVGAQFKRALQNGCGPGVVHQATGADFLGQLGYGRNIRNFQERVGRCLN